ncbi:MAG: methyl-accepting chemotaxis protein [Holosporales bacterium]|jgi:methyl-accepting chemotaxis protein
MRLTIQRRLTILSAISLSGLVLLFGLYFSTLKEVETITTQIENLIKERRDIMQGRFANKSLTLVAMDVLVDKESRVLGKEREAEARTYIIELERFIESSKNDTPEIIAIRNDTATLERLILVDMLKALQQSDNSAALAILDDSIDETASRVEENFKNADNNITLLLEKKFADKSTMLEAKNISATVIFLITALLSISSLIWQGRAIMRTLTNLSNRFNTACHQAFAGLRGSTEGLSNTANALTNRARETAVETQQVGGAISGTQQNIQSVAAAAEELANSCAEIKRQVEESSKISTAAVLQAKGTSQTMQSLSSSADEINAVVALISSIAEKTNLLALNATIEAVRAGEAGRGFSVVASEVKSLAAQTAAATTDIIKKVGEVQSISKYAVEAIADISQTIEKMDSICSGISAAVTQQTSATAEISSAAAGVAHNAAFVTGAINGVGEATEATEKSSKMVLEAANALEGEQGQLAQTLQDFIRDLKAA